jgi:hypothetical protein
MADCSHIVNSWQTIPFAADYAVSSDGRVKRIAAQPWHRCGCELKPKRRRDGYLEVSLYVAGKTHYYRVHQLVCAVFHGPKPVDAHEVGHKDGCRHNNNANNLRWVSKSENYADRIPHGTDNAGQRNGQAKVDELTIAQIRQSNLPSRKAAEKFGLSKSQINNIRSGYNWTKQAA